MAENFGQRDLYFLFIFLDIKSKRLLAPSASSALELKITSLNNDLVQLSHYYNHREFQLKK